MRKYSVVVCGLMFGAVVQAAPIVDISAPSAFAPPDAIEFVNGSSLLAAASSAGTVINPMRGAPAVEVNPGLDGQLPALLDDADSLEVGVVPLPAPSHACPPQTPVTISVSEWALTLISASPGVAGSGGGGSVLLDSRDPSVAAPASAATAIGVSNPGSIGGTIPVPARLYAGTFADLPFLTLLASVSAARYDIATVVQSHYRAVVPSITLEYDDGQCTLLAAATGESHSVPTLSNIALTLLSAMLLLLARLGRARRW